MNKNKHKIAAIIPCRLESTRLFGKQLQPLGSFPILHLVLKNIEKSNLVDEVVLAISKKSSNESLVNFAKSHKLKFILGDDIDVLKRLIIAARYVKADIIIRLSSENPFLYFEGIDPLIKRHIEGNFDLSTYFNMPLGSSIEIINLKALEISHKFGKKRHRSEYSAMYIYEHPEKFKILKLEPIKTLQKPNLRLTIDTPEDLIVARKIRSLLGKKDKPIPLEKIIEFLDQNTKIKKINSKIHVKYTRHDLNK